MNNHIISFIKNLVGRQRIDLNQKIKEYHEMDNYNENIFTRPTSAQAETYNVRKRQAFSNSQSDFQTDPIKLHVWSDLQTKVKTIFLIDRDKDYCDMMLDYANSRGVSLICYPSISVMGPMGMFSNCDIAIIEAEHGELTGLEVGEIFHSLLNDKPMIIVSEGISPTEDSKQDWPISIVGFFRKDFHPDDLLDCALAAC